MAARTGTIEISRRFNVKSRRGTDKHVVEKKKIAFFVLIFGTVFFLMIFMSALSADLRSENNRLIEKNEYIQAEIDSLNDEIGEATNIKRIEKIATEELGMVQADSKNNIKITQEDKSSMDLAAKIKDEAYS